MTRVRVRRSLWIAVPAFLAVAVLACDDGSPYTTSGSSTKTPQSGGSEGSSRRELCDALDELRSSLSSVSESRSIDEVQAWVDDVQSSADRVKEASSNAGLQVSEKLNDGLDDFSSSLDDAMASDQPLTQTIVMVSEAIVRVSDRLEEAQSEGGCQTATNALEVGAGADTNSPAGATWSD